MRRAGTRDLRVRLTATNVFIRITSLKYDFMKKSNHLHLLLIAVLAVLIAGCVSDSYLYGEWGTRRTDYSLGGGGAASVFYYINEDGTYSIKIIEPGKTEYNVEAVRTIEGTYKLEPETDNKNEGKITFQPKDGLGRDCSYVYEPRFTFVIGVGADKLNLYCGTESLIFVRESYRSQKLNESAK